MSGKKEIITHGYNCKKAPHTLKTGYLHAEEDDSPYVVDSVTYCGRCHTFMVKYEQRFQNERD